MKVIASAGSSAKCDYVRSLGADVVFNYKEDGYDVLKQHKPIHLYWVRRVCTANLVMSHLPDMANYQDNVGGEALEAAIEHLEPFSRVVVSGILAMILPAPRTNIVSLVLRLAI